MFATVVSVGMDTELKVLLEGNSLDPAILAWLEHDKQHSSTTADRSDGATERRVVDSAYGS